MNPIKKRIQELCPDVMELKFGCEMRYPADPHGYALKIVGLSYDEVNGIEQVYSVDLASGLEYLVVKREKWGEILGSPITLAVVFRAINVYSQDHDIDAAKALSVSPATGYLSVFLVADIVRRWDKAKDNFDDQTKETQDFIGKLLGV